MNTITIELCKEDRQRLDEVIAFLGLIAGELKSRPVSAEAVTAPQTEEKPKPLAMEHPVDAVSPHGEPEPEIHPDEIPEVTASTYKWTQADILGIVQRLIAPGSTKRAAAKAIVNDYAVKISAIPADKYNEVMDRLVKLEKES